MSSPADAQKVTVVRYDPSQAARWNDFCRTARNATFLFDRRFMDYHSDRFEDCSLIALDSRGGMIAALPASIHDDGRRIVSHGGLTYGGWIVAARHFNALTMLALWEATRAWMRDNGVGELVYKALPWIYATRPADDDRHALRHIGAEWKRCDLSLAIDLRNPGAFNESARQGLKLSLFSGVSVDEEGPETLPAYWRILEECLAERHNARPVHTLEEITMLRERFPENIRLVVARDMQGRLLSGTLLFLTPRVVHTQYIATTALGRSHKAFAGIAAWLIEKFTPTHHYLDFGTSADDATPSGFNEGLLLQKSGFGASGVACDTFVVSAR